MILPKKMVAVLLIFTLMIFTSSCSVRKRMDFTEFLLRSEKNFGEDVFFREKAFYSDDSWFLFLSILSDDDFLISARENEKKTLESVTVSTFSSENKEKEEIFIRLCSAVSFAFITEEKPEVFLEKLELSEEGSVFSDDVLFFTEGRYKASLFNSDMGSTLMIEMIY